MVTRTSRTLLGLVTLVVLTFSVLGAASFAPSARGASVAPSAVHTTTSSTRLAQETISVIGHAASLPLYAVSSGPSAAIPYGVGPDPCLDVTITSTKVLNSNQVKIGGRVTNAKCGFTVTKVELTTNNYISNCEGSATQAGTSRYLLPDLTPNTYDSWIATDTGYCEVCEDHLPVLWPPFTLVFQADAAGDGPNNPPIIAIDTGTARASFALQNSSKYSIPCP